MKLSKYIDDFSEKCLSSLNSTVAWVQSLDYAPR